MEIAAQRGLYVQFLQNALNMVVLGLLFHIENNSCTFSILPKKALVLKVEWSLSSVCKQHCYILEV
jgi:hypothetical protein